MKKSLTILMVVAMIFCMMPECSVFAESSTLNVDVDTSTMSVIPVDMANPPAAEGISPWGGEEVDKMFDGMYGIPDTRTDESVYDRSASEKGTKLGGQVTSEDKQITITFSTAGTSKLEYYSLYTGFDSGWEAGRNPVAWTLYGMGETDWVEIHKIESSDTVTTGMQDVNCTPFTYQVPAENVGEYIDYKIEFTVVGEFFQMNELVLYGSAKLNSAVDTSALSVIRATNPVAEGITPWGGEEVDKLFDGKYGVTSDDATQDPYSRSDDEKGTKLGGQVTSEDKKVIVTFSTDGKNPIEYYTFVTGFDATKENGRNPIAWTLYAMFGEDYWVPLHEVVSDGNIATGLEDINCGSYTYAVPQTALAKKAYTDYKIEFTVSGDYFQMNEVILQSTAAEVETSDTDTDDTSANTTVDSKTNEEASTDNTTADTTGTTNNTTSNNTNNTNNTTDNATDNTDEVATNNSADSNPINPLIIVLVVVAVVAVVAIIVVVAKKKKA